MRQPPQPLREPEEEAHYGWEHETIVEIDPSLIKASVRELPERSVFELRHREEDLAACAKRKARARDVAVWNVEHVDEPISVAEYNWLRDGEWFRQYTEIEQGHHRSEYAVKIGLPRIWAQIHTFRFSPSGARPPDRLMLPPPPPSSDA